MSTSAFAVSTIVVLLGFGQPASADPVTLTVTGTIESIEGQVSLLPVPPMSQAGDAFTVTWTFEAPPDAAPDPRVGDYGASEGGSRPGNHAFTVAATTVSDPFIASFALIVDGGLGLPPFFIRGDFAQFAYAGSGWDARYTFSGADWLNGDGLPNGPTLEGAPFKALDIGGSDEFGGRGHLSGSIRSVATQTGGSVPEPGTITLISFGLVTIAGLRRPREAR